MPAEATPAPFATDRTARADAVTREAARGDHAATAAYLAENYGFLLAMARKCASGVVDPEDLLAEALSKLLARWDQGLGPSERVNSYVIMSMRNNVVDELRSPRRRTVSTELMQDVFAEPDSRMEAIDSFREYELVREAFFRLPQDQRRILVELVVLGAKPRELQDQSDRTSGAIYSLVARAKKNLRRHLGALQQ